MAFAVKASHSEAITISAHTTCALTLTNLALAPGHNTATLYILSRQTNDFILVVELIKQLKSSYSCAIKLILDDAHPHVLLCQHGQIHIIGNVEPLGPPNSSLDPFDNPIIISRSIGNADPNRQETQGSGSKQKQKVESKSKRSVNFKQQNLVQVQPKANSNKQSNNKKQKSILEMMQNLSKEQSSDSDDQSYEQQSQDDEDDEQESSAEEQEEQASHKNKQAKSQSDDSHKNSKKKSSWADMLRKEMKAKPSLDEEEEESEEQLDDKTPKVQPKKASKKQTPTEKRQTHKSKSQPQTTNQKPAKVANGEDDSSFQFQVPIGLPLFLADANTIEHK